MDRDGADNGAWAAAATAANASERDGDTNNESSAHLPDASDAGNSKSSRNKPAPRPRSAPSQPASHQLPPPQRAELPHRRPLPSYVSEPPSALFALSVMAQEEESKLAAAAAAGQLPSSPFDAATRPVLAPSAEPSRRDMAWLHSSPEDLAKSDQDKAHQRTLAGDLAGLEPQSRRPRQVAFEIGSPMATGSNRGGATNTPAKVINHLRSLHRRDADVLLVEDNSDDDDEITKPKKTDRELEQYGSLDLDIDVPNTATVKPPFYRRRWFWLFCIFLAWSLSFVTAGVCLLVFHPDSATGAFQAWRLCFFLAGLPVIWYIGDFVSLCIVWAVEKSMFTVKNALYFAYAVRRPMRNVIRALLALGWWPLMMTVAYSDKPSDAAKKAYNIVLRIWACVTLFMVANLIKVLLGKILALKFNKESHLAKLYATLKKEQWLHRLLMPRQSYIAAAEASASAEAQLEYPEDGDLQKGFGSMGPKSSKRRFGFRSASATQLVNRTGQDGTAAEIDGNGRLSRRGSSSGSFGEKILFWRRGSAPLPAITEDSTEDECADAIAGSGNGDDCHSKDVAITIDDARDAAAAAQGAVKRGTSLPPVRTEHINPVFAPSSGGATINSPLSAINPLPDRSAIEAATSKQHGGRSTTQSPSKHPARGSSLSPRSRLQRTSSAPHSVGSRSQSMNPGSGLSFSEPLKRDQVMTRLAKLERYIRKTALEVTFRDALNNVERSAVTSEEEAKRVGVFLFWNVKSDFEKSVISKEDLDEFIHVEEVDSVYEMLDDDGDGKITAEDCIAAVQTIFQERRNLAASLKDTRSIASSLEAVLGTILHILFGMLYLFILFSITFADVWTFVTTVILGLSFIFGTYIRTIFENVMFLFNSHPFDVGDMLFMDNDFLTVDEMQINFTVFVNSSRQRVWMPNQRLVNNPFVNLSTSGNRTESIKILVDMDTPPSVLDDIVAAMRALMEEIPQEIADCGGSFKDAAVPMKMTLALWFDFTHNGTNLSRCSRIRSRVHICVAQALQKAGVNYTWPALRTLDLPSSRAAGAVAGAIANNDPVTAFMAR